MKYPKRRLRRLRRTPALRNLVTENRLHPSDLIAPLFVHEGITEPIPISSMPGQFQHTKDSVRQEVAELHRLGITSVILFGIPAHKDAAGTEAWNPRGIIQTTLTALKSDLGDEIVLVADLCMDEYTSHGHCGVLDSRGNVDNDATLDIYARIAEAQAAAGADVIAPSGMMDGQVESIRSTLDDAGFEQTVILAYSAKYATALYGPFRNAVEVTIACGGDRRTYQQDTNNAREALEEIRLDLAEGADIVMIKPALPYLDVISRARQAFDIPIAAYHVSGEYSMVCAAAEKDWIDLDAVAHEHISAIKRAGASIVVTYFARHLATLMQQHKHA